MSDRTGENWDEKIPFLENEETGDDVTLLIPDILNSEFLILDS
jgi:hypothetical protein